MNLLDKQNYYNNIKKARDHYKISAQNYNEVVELLDKALEKIDIGIDWDKTTLHANNTTMCDKLKHQTIETRKNFIELNKFNDSDLEKLSGLLVKEISFNTPVLDLFPGLGQFLPYVLAAEPLYIADRFHEINDIAAQNLKNDFYVSRRLRKYKVNYFNLRGLPQHSFGLVYCFNEFFFADEEYILNWSSLIHNLLYEGGKFIFNFLPDDQEWAIEFNQRFQFSTIDYEQLCKKLELQGFYIEACEINKTKSSFIIACKKGEKVMLHKIHPNVAEIIDL